MTEFQRGKITGITFTVEYPDASTKTSTVADPADIASITFDPAQLSDEDVQQFNVSADDWTQNPSMFIRMKDPTLPFRTACIPGPC